MLSMACRKQKAQSQWEPHWEWNPPLSANGADKQKRFPSLLLRLLLQQGQANVIIRSYQAYYQAKSVNWREQTGRLSARKIISQRRTFWITPAAGLQEKDVCYPKSPWRKNSLLARLQSSSGEQAERKALEHTWKEHVQRSGEGGL